MSHQPSRTARWAVAALLIAALSGCGGDDDYCASVKDQQAELTDVTTSGRSAALLDALPILQDLADDAPEDIRDEWQTLLDPLEELDDALADADVDPASYDPEHLPVSLPEAQRLRIEDAASALADPAVVRAFDGVQQQAKDVCHTPLSL